MAEKCTVLSLPVADLDSAVADPALAALLRDGWTVITAITVVDERDQPETKLVLAPPTTGKAGPGPWVPLGLAVVAGIAAGATSELLQLLIGAAG